ncbi:MAG: Hpt domain-containing protein [Aestuariivirga sp.]
MRGFSRILTSAGYAVLMAQDEPSPAAHASGMADDLMTLPLRHAGMDVCLTKPFTVAAIVACLETHFSACPLAAPIVEVADALDAPPVLDPSVIGELRTIGGNEALFRRVLDLFASQVPQAVDKIESMRHSTDLTAMADAVHALKSMCANIGTSRATAACHDLDCAARTGESFNAGGKIGIIAAEMLNLMSEIERLRTA